MWLNTKTEYSFGAVCGKVDDIVKKLSTMADYAGIADIGNTFGHVPWNTACKKYGIKPIFGVQLPAVENLVQDKSQKARFPRNWMTIIAKNNQGLSELYELVDKAHKQFYYIPRLSYEQINQSSEDLFIFSRYSFEPSLISKRFVHQELSPSTPENERTPASMASIDNYYINKDDFLIYEAFADERKRERKTTLMHIPTEKEWANEVSLKDKFSYLSLKNTSDWAKVLNATLPSAPMVKWEGKQTLEKLCMIGLKKRGLNFCTGDYGTRYRHELKIIKEKKFQDYFLVVADLVKYAKTKMCVGPARGSAAGSLICYLLGITEVDPLKYGLSFERFIDLNRADLPDIDIDFQDDKRHLVLKYLEKKYGKDNVAQIANVNRLKPKSALNRVAKALSLPLGDIEEIKTTASNVKEVFENSEIGQAFLSKYPAMRVAADIEGHASHAGVHAAGVLVCNSPVTSYCGINSRENKQIAMIDKRDAEKLNLLKIDALGLRTLSIIAEVCDDIGKPYEWIYQLPRDDKQAFEIFNQHRFSGIFQFEGEAIKKLAVAMPIETIEDISALSALGRPGPLASGAAWDYVNAHAGREKVKWISSHPLIVEATKETFGVITYQEQVMKIVREIGDFSWANTGAVRRVIAKSKGEELEKFSEMFQKGAAEKGVHTGSDIWEQIKTFGGYAFNKSHAISYGLISYFCAYLKAHFPLEFVKACLNHSKDDNSAVEILRDAVENEGIEYEHIDQNHSMQKWSAKKWERTSKLYGGFLSIHGIGPAAANKIVKYREEGKEFPAGIQKHLKNDISPFKYLYPAKELYGEYYASPEKVNLRNPCVPISEIVSEGSYNIIGKLTEKNLRDANEAILVAKRNGQYEKSGTNWLNLTLQDDTGSIMVQIRKKDYQRLGKDIAETGEVDTDWYLVNGNKADGYSLLFVNNIMKITK